jgi:hypothetical protein
MKRSTPQSGDGSRRVLKGGLDWAPLAAIEMRCDRPSIFAAGSIAVGRVILPGNDRTATPRSLPAEGAAVEQREKPGGFPQWNLKVYPTS